MAERIEIPDAFPQPGDVERAARRDHGRRPRARRADRACVLAAGREGGARRRGPSGTSRRSPTTLPGETLVFSGDVRDADFNEAVADGTVAEWGGVDVWICNAGISPIVAGPLAIAPEVWRDVIDVNLTGAFLGARAAARVMGEGGRLIFTGSVLGERPRKGLTAYSASKAGLVGMAKGLALDLAPAGITVNVVSPGWFESPLADGFANNERLAESILRTRRCAGGAGRPTSPGRSSSSPRTHRRSSPATVIHVDGGYQLV